MTARSTFDRPAVNPSREELSQRWHYDRTTRLFDLAPSRHPAGHVVASENSPFDDPGTLVSTARIPDRRPAADRPL